MPLKKKGFFNKHQVLKGGFGKEYFGIETFSLVLSSHQIFSVEKIKKICSELWILLFSFLNERKCM